MPTSSASPTVARLRTPGELLAAVPLLCGFVPAASLVLLCLRGRQRRLVLTARVDLPPAGAERALAGQVVDHVGRAGAQEVVLSVWCDDEGARPHAAVVDEVVRACEDAGIEVGDALLVRGGRWWAYACADSSCCAAAGTALTQAAPAVELVAAHAVLDGRAVLPSREALEASLRAPVGTAAAAAHLRRAEDDRGRRLAAEGRARAGARALAQWRRALTDAPDDATAAALAVSLRDLVVRDAVLTWLLDDEQPLLGLLLDLLRRTPAPHDAQLCALLAWTAHARGDGALANVALDRALASDPRCSLAQLGRSALDRQVPPSDVRTLLARSRAALRAEHPWTAGP